MHWHESAAVILHADLYAVLLAEWHSGFQLAAGCGFCAWIIHAIQPKHDAVHGHAGFRAGGIEALVVQVAGGGDVQNADAFIGKQANSRRQIALNILRLDRETRTHGQLDEVEAQRPHMPRKLWQRQVFPRFDEERQVVHGLTFALAAWRFR